MDCKIKCPNIVRPIYGACTIITRTRTVLMYNHNNNYNQVYYNSIILSTVPQILDTNRTEIHLKIGPTV